MDLFAARRIGTATLVVALGGILTVGLAGCVPSSSKPHSSARASSSPSPSSSASASASASASPGSPPPSVAPPAGGTAGKGTAVKIGCNTLEPPQTVYDFNPNFGLDSGFTPKAGTPAASAVADGGTACNWLNQTSGDTFTIAVAQPSPARLASVKSTAATGTPGSGVGDSSYFSTGGGVGRVDAFSGKYWISATSVYFGSVGDAATLLNAALAALK